MIDSMDSNACGAEQRELDELNLLFDIARTLDRHVELKEALEIGRASCRERV